MGEKPGVQSKKKSRHDSIGINKTLATTYFPTKNVVSSAQVGLTALFGMGRGEHHCNSHQKILNDLMTMLGKKLSGIGIEFSIESYGQLVLLGFDITVFRPAAYQRHSL